MKKIVFAVVAIALAASVCVAAEPFKIGAVLAVTGPASWLGGPEKETLKMLEAQINAAGGIKGRQVEVIIYDTESDEMKSVTMLKKLIASDEVSVIIGPSTSGESMAAVPIVMKEKVPMISLAAAIPIADPAKERQWVFKTATSDNLAVGKIFSHMKKQGLTKVGIITISNGYGDSGRTQLTKLAPQYGITIIADERYAPRDTDMTVQLTKIKASGAQAVVNWSVGPPQVIVMKNAKQIGLGLPLFQSSGFGSKLNIEQAEGAAEGVMAPLGRLMVASQLPDSDPQKAVVLKYASDYQAATKQEPSFFGGHAWDAFMLASGAFAEVGDNREKVRDWIERKKGFVGIGGIFNFSPDDHSGLSEEAFVITVVKKGDFVLAQ